MTSVHARLCGILFALCLISVFSGNAQEPPAANPPSPADAATVKRMVTEAYQHLDNGELDDALQEVDSVLQLDSRNASVYELRGAIYVQKKLWNRARSDYQMALEIDPTSVSFKYQLAEIDFLQKSYPAARQGFTALMNDPNLGELARYKVFLCNLLEGRDDVAAKDLEALNKAPKKNQCYYFCNALWDLFHKNRQGANSWIASASRIYSSPEMDRYLSSLKDLNNLKSPIVTFTTKQGETYSQAKAFVVNDGLRISTPTGWISIPFEQLPEDLSVFPADLRKQIEVRQNRAATPILNVELLSFTTKRGKQYDQVKWSAEEDGLRILTPDGWITVPFDQLPDDLTHFSAEARQEIAAKQTTALAKAAAAAQLTSGEAGPTPQEKDATIAAMESAQFNLYPEEAKDCRFGTCIALEGSLSAIGADGATYVYENDELKARLCPGMDSTQTGDLVNSISISHQTIAIGTQRGVYLWSATAKGWKLQAHLDIANPSTVVLDGDHLVIGTNGNGSTNGDVSFYTRQGEKWAAVPRNINRDGSYRSADLFGHIVALKGNTALIGNPNWSKDAYDHIGPSYSGRVYVETFDGKTWKEEAQLASTEPAVGANQFGASVALSDNLIAVSRSNRDGIDYAPHHGAIHLYKKSGNAWGQMAIIKSPDSSNDAGFGSAPLALFEDTLAVGDPGVSAKVPNVILDTGDNTGSAGAIKKTGAIYIYEKQVLQDTLLAPNPVDSLRRLGSPEQFGASIALGKDRIMVGSPGKNAGTGSVYIWKRQGNQWHLEKELKGFHKQANFNY